MTNNEDILVEEMLENKEAEIESIEYKASENELNNDYSADTENYKEAEETEETEQAKDNRTKEELFAATEAILFSMGDAVELPHLAQALSLSREDAKAVVEELMDTYKNEARGIQIIELEGAYQLCTKKELHDYLVKIAHVPKPRELTDVMLETLSIIAYKQPVTKLEIEKIRGVKSDHTVNKLVE